MERSVKNTCGLSIVKTLRSLLFVTALFFMQGLRAQMDTIVIRIDHSMTEKKCDGTDCKYFVDNKQVSFAEYEKHRKEPSIADCKPCYLKYLNEKGTLVYEGDFYTDCCIGTYITRYANGQVKLKGQYRAAHSLAANDPANLGYCRPAGEWKYYKENGDLEKTEYYKNGERIQTTP